MPVHRFEHGATIGGLHADVSACLGAGVAQVDLPAVDDHLRKRQRWQFGDDLQTQTLKENSFVSKRMNFALFAFAATLACTLFLLCVFVVLLVRLRTTKNRHVFTRCPSPCTVPATCKHLRKPDWLRLEVLRIKAHMPHAGCRLVAYTFNRLHPHTYIGKTFVAELIAQHQLEITQLRGQLRSTQPHAIRVNSTWAIDMTFFTDTQRTTHAAIGIIDHGSRQALRLHTLAQRCSWALFGHLCFAIAKYGKPKRLRTDNKPVFNSRVFNGLLKLAGIQHQTTQKHAPWQNGRIERLFGSLKPLLKQLVIPNQYALQTALHEFKYFYNHIRPHHNLHGLTPAEHFAGIRPADIRQMPIKEAIPVQTLTGQMRGYWIRR